MEEEFYCTCNENKGADQLCIYCTADLTAKMNCVFFLCGSSHTTVSSLNFSAAPYFEGHDGNIKETITRNVRETTTLVCDPKGIPVPDKTWYRVDQRNRNKMRKWCLDLGF